MDNLDRPLGCLEAKQTTALLFKYRVNSPGSELVQCLVPVCKT